MNTILQKRIEEASIRYSCANPSEFDNGMYNQTDLEWAYEAGATYALQHQWISVEEALPKEQRILARLSGSFCGRKDYVEVLYRILQENVDLRHPDGYYDIGGENVPTSAITHWMPIPPISEGGEK